MPTRETDLNLERGGGGPRPQGAATAVDLGLGDDGGGARPQGRRRSSALGAGAAAKLGLGGDGGAQPGAGRNLASAVNTEENQGRRLGIEEKGHMCR